MSQQTGTEEFEDFVEYEALCMLLLRADESPNSRVIGEIHEGSSVTILKVLKLGAGHSDLP